VVSEFVITKFVISEIHSICFDFKMLVKLTIGINFFKRTKKTPQGFNHQTKVLQSISFSSSVWSVLGVNLTNTLKLSTNVLEHGVDMPFSFTNKTAPIFTSSPFHQHYMNSFCANILLPKIHKAKL